MGLDTNVLVRIVTGDDPSAQRAALALLADRATADEPAFVNRIALVEFVWVLESAYGYGRSTVADAVERLLRTTDVLVEDGSLAWSALRSYRAGADFADALLAETNTRAGCDRTATFDRAAVKRLAHLALVPF